MFKTSFINAKNSVRQLDQRKAYTSGTDSWIESYVKSMEEREYLFDLNAGANSLLAKHGRSDELDLIFKSYSNLLRKLGD